MNIFQRQGKGQKMMGGYVWKSCWKQLEKFSTFTIAFLIWLSRKAELLQKQGKYSKKRLTRHGKYVNVKKHAISAYGEKAEYPLSPYGN